MFASKVFDVETQYGNQFIMRDFHFITDNPWTSDYQEIDVTFKIRHTPDFTRGKVLLSSSGEVHLRSNQRL